MNENELKYLKARERAMGDATSLPLGYLLKSIWIKIRRRTLGKFLDVNARHVWTVNEVSDAAGPADNVRNYIERRTIRSILSGMAGRYPLQSACEIGCGYGRLTMVLAEFAGKVVGFEREWDLVETARRLLPSISFYRVTSLDKLTGFDKGPFDLVLSCTVLQHLTDSHCRAVIGEMKSLAPRGHILLIEKTDDIATTSRFDDGNIFLSRARALEVYEELMRPYELVSVGDRVLEPGYINPHPGKCMLFRSPSLK